jgi:hypothetical protein
MASETWDCVIAVPSENNAASSKPIRIRIDGDTLEWQVLADKQLLKPSSPPTWVPLFEYQLLVENSVGIVAALPQAYQGHATGLALGAWVLTILKPSGDYQVATVKFTGQVSSDSKGHCQLRPAGE